MSSWRRPHSGIGRRFRAVRSARASALATTLSPAEGLAAPLSQEVQLSTTDALASAARIGDHVLMDAANDAKHGDGKKIDGRERRYYMLKVTTTVHPLTTPTASDWGVLYAGMHVLGGEYMTLVYKPGNPSRWYVTCVPPRHVVVPTHLLLLGRLDVQLKGVFSPNTPFLNERARLAPYELTHVPATVRRA
eukprot:scaffold74916_cov101-Phaeocystis_antarctica.AAC.1